MRLRNLASLFVKELSSLWRDPAALLLVAFAFSIAIYTVSRDIKTEVLNAPVAVVDHDRTALSFRLRDALQAPMFKPAADLAPEDVDSAMASGRYIFVLDIPPHFEADVLKSRHPTAQLLIDATTMTQAGLGAAYIQQIVARETSAFAGAPDSEAIAPLEVKLRDLFNPNHQALWFVSVMQITLNLTILSIVLVGAAFMRERERGTIDHLLVMPVSAAEIALAKIGANSLVVLLATWFALDVVVRWALGVPIQGSALLFLACAAPYLFSTAAIGVLLATLADSMPQFALISIPVFVILSMLSGAITPMESMPTAMRVVMQASPTTHFVVLSEAILFRGAGLKEVWTHLAAIVVIGVTALTIALARFNQVMSRIR
jgi:ABC-2 type transport system permease protein